MLTKNVGKDKQKYIHKVGYSDQQDMQSYSLPAVAHSKEQLCEGLIFETIKSIAVNKENEQMGRAGAEDEEHKLKFQANAFNIPVSAAKFNVLVMQATKCAVLIRNSSLENQFIVQLELKDQERGKQSKKAKQLGFGDGLFVRTAMAVAAERL